MMLIYYLHLVRQAEAFEFGKFDDNKFLMDLQDYFMCPMNLAGIPALAVLAVLQKTGCL